MLLAVLYQGSTNRDTRTWRGERGEEWSSAQGLESILLSIQSLMSSNPYENEPGYEDANGPEDKKNQKDYVMKIRHESLRISVIQRLESYLAIGTSGTVAPESSSSEESEREEMDGEAYDNAPYEPFKDLCKRRFMWYYDSYLLAINGAKRDVQDGQPFARMPFEGGGNDMVGKFNYTELERRLVRIKSALDAEIAGWAKEGFESKRKDTGVAANLQRQHEQVVEHFKKSSHSTSVEMVDGNPFLWEITYFGRPMSQLDGGMFRFKLCMSPRFPEEQPRAKFETKMFHHRIAADGTPCYTTDKPEDMRSHMDAIISALEEEHPPYDPRTTVNPEASKLYWGSKEDKKKYNRQLRRAVERSAEL